MKPVALHLVPSPPASPDTEALAAVAPGDMTALGQIYDRHAPHLLRFATRISTNHDAEDLVQATFIQAARIAASYDGRAPTARSWLFGIMARLAQERRRSFARFTRAILRFGTAQDEAAPASAGRNADLDRGLRTLSEAKRIVLILAEVEGYTCEEISEILAVPVGTVWTRLHHARKEMRTFYEGSTA